LNNPWACRHRWDQSCGLPEDLNRTFKHMPHSTCQDIPENHRVYGYKYASSLLARLSPPPCDFALFPIRKWNWRDDVSKQCPTSKGNRKRYSTVSTEVT
jgi:hypothetical protein